MGQVLRQVIGHLILVHAGLLGKLLDLVLTQGAANLLSADRLVAARADPRLHLLAQATTLKLRHQVVQTFLAAHAPGID